MIKMYVRHTVDDLAKWKIAFDENDVTRKKFGAKKSEVFTNYLNPKDILVVIRVESKKEAGDFLENSGIKEVMKDAGVIGAPDIKFGE
jgi:hypothetical protein